MKLFVAQRPLQLGEIASKLTLYKTGNFTYLFDWVIPPETIEIGIWVEQHGERPVLADYDGVFSLPSEAIEMLRDVGVVVED